MKTTWLSGDAGQAFGLLVLFVVLIGAAVLPCLK